MEQREIEANVKAMINAPGQFALENGIVLDKVDRDYAQGTLHLQKTSFNPYGKVHGGLLATLGDTIGGGCASSRGENCVTANYSIEYLRVARGPYIRCVATPKKMGRKISVIAVEMTDEEKRVIATGTFTYFMEAPTNQ